MPPFTEMRYAQRLLSAARTYNECFGYVVIPVFGDTAPEKSKASAVEWKSFQNRRPNESEFERWFLQEQWGGLAIITGRISGLVVLDFDDEALSRQFARACPHLADTRTVKSAGRGLPHHYFHLPPHLSIASQRAPGVDLQSDGRYVVAPPTTINGMEYKVAVGGMPYTLTANDVRLLSNFIRDVRVNAASALLDSATIVNESEQNSISYASYTARSDADSYPNLPSDSDIKQHLQEKSPPEMVKPPRSQPQIFLTPQMLIQQYRAHAQLIGRNHALFQQACSARDAGWTEAMTTAVLIPTHVDYPAPPGHRPETPAQRHQEAVATIRSAFSRPRRKPQIQPQMMRVSSLADNDASFIVAKNVSFAMNQPSPQNSDHPDKKSLSSPRQSVSGLPGSLREKLLQLKMCHTLRVLDALLMANVKPGTCLTEKLICEILHNIVGRYSIRQALRATLPDGTLIFQQQTPSPVPPTPTHVAADSAVDRNNNCVLFRVTKPNKIRRGRPAVTYLMPDSANLCARLNLKLTGSDKLAPADVSGVKSYRQSLHREFLQRRPGQYSRKWLAQRLGVSVRSVQRYRQDSGILAKPVYHALPLSWYTLNYIPVGLPLGGMFLQSETGKRYPPLREIARYLLARRERVMLMRQDVNHYSVPPTETGDTDRPRLKLAEVDHLPEKAMLQRLRELTTTPNINIKNDINIHDKPINELSVKSKAVMMARDDDSHAVLRPAAERENSIIIPQVAPKFVRRPVPKLALRPEYEVKSKRHYRQPLSDTDREAAANRLYTTLRQRCTEKAGYLSLAKARRLADEFGTMPLEQALTTLQQRHNIHNPAGFVMSYLRSQRFDMVAR